MTVFDEVAESINLSPANGCELTGSIASSTGALTVGAGAVGAGVGTGRGAGAGAGDSPNPGSVNPLFMYQYVPAATESTKMMMKIVLLFIIILYQLFFREI